jgi:superfamily I DNA/RNA helicase
VHKAKGLEWPRVLMSSNFNKFVELEGDKPVIDLEEAYIMYIAVTRARKKLVISPACAEIISACAAARAGRIGQQPSSDAERSEELHRSRPYSSVVRKN